MYEHKNLNCGFVILCPDQNINLLKSTANSIIGRYPESPFVCVAEGNTNKEDIDEMKKICPVFIGKSTFSSLINVGMDNALGEWNFLVCAGAIIRPKIDERFSLFVNNKKVFANTLFLPLWSAGRAGSATLDVTEKVEAITDSI